ncbi:MAG TPA: Crp/Fnr family transcriptional regulator, partial [Negativicutes bacterium]|nr:Crp/Fnr family transcriptional regulator [Negativicutes bacterium]
MQKAQPSLLKALQPEEIARFKQLAELMQMKAGQVIFAEEDFADAVYIVEQGHVKIYHNSVAGKNSIMSIRGPGDLFGVAAVLLREKRCAFAETMGEGAIWRMEGKTFVDMVYECPRLAMEVALTHGRYLRDAETAIGQLLSMDADQRVAWLLLRLASPVSTPEGEKIRISVRLTHQDLASMIGSCRQTTTTALGRLQRAGIINFGKRYID